MNLYEVNAESLAKQLGVIEVPEAFVIVAKHQVLGLTNEQIAETLCADVSDIVECEEDELFKQVKQFVSGVYASQQEHQSTGWDAIESIAIQGLIKRLPAERDSDFLLKVAAVANRATRRLNPQQDILDPSRMAGKRTITLTQRLVSKINEQGERVQTQERKISISDGTMSKPGFEEIDSLLNVKSVPVLAHSPEIRTHSIADPSVNELLADFNDRQKKRA